MTIYLGLFDPSQPAEDSSFWSWRAEPLERSLLDKLYYEVAVKNRPEEPNKLSLSDVVGGFVSFNSEWAFVYRFYNGGRDAHGRPGRFVIIVAGVRNSETRTSDLSSILECDAFQRIAMIAAKTCPIPKPESLEIELSAAIIEDHVDPLVLSSLIRGERKTYSGVHAFSEAAKVFASLPDDQLRLVRLDGNATGQFAEVSCFNYKESVPPQPDLLNRTVRESLGNAIDSGRTFDADVGLSLDVFVNDFELDVGKVAVTTENRNGQTGRTPPGVLDFKNMLLFATALVTFVVLLFSLGFIDLFPKDTPPRIIEPSATHEIIEPDSPRSIKIEQRRQRSQPRPAELDSSMATPNSPEIAVPKSTPLSEWSEASTPELDQQHVARGFSEQIFAALALFCLLIVVAVTLLFMFWRQIVK